MGRRSAAAGLIDERHLVVSPVLLGSGEPLLEGLNLPQLGYRPSETVGTAQATQHVMTKTA